MQQTQLQALEGGSRLSISARTLCLDASLYFKFDARVMIWRGLIPLPSHGRLGCGFIPKYHCVWRKKIGEATNICQIKFYPALVREESLSRSFERLEGREVDVHTCIFVLVHRPRHSPRSYGNANSTRPLTTYIRLYIVIKIQSYSAGEKLCLWESQHTSKITSTLTRILHIVYQIGPVQYDLLPSH